VVKEFASRTECVRALDGVDLEIAAGELTLLVGPSGCGKTTLISVLVGLLTPTAGDVEILGTTLTGLCAAEVVEFRRREIGFVFQQYNLLPTLTAAENAAVPLVVAGSGWRLAVARAKEVLEELGLGAQWKALPQGERILTYDPAIACELARPVVGGRAGAPTNPSPRRGSP
jgi:putative ABC transport system ATP-binding protein